MVNRRKFIQASAFSSLAMAFSKIASGNLKTVTIKGKPVFKQGSEEFKAETLFMPPPGAPIGDMDWELCGN